MKFLSGRIRIIEAGLVASLFGLFGASVLLFYMSADEALSNPALAHMRFPVLAIAYTIIIMIAAIVTLSIQLLEEIRRDSFFAATVARRLKQMGHISLSAVIPLVTLIVYTELNISGSITQFGVVVGVGIVFVIGNLFYVVSAAFEAAAQVKREHDLTV